MYKLKETYRKSVIANDDHVKEIATRFNRKFITVFDWFRTKKQKQLTSLEMLDTLSILLKVPAGELYEHSSTGKKSRKKRVQSV